MIDGSAAIHPHNLGLLMLRGISSTGPFGRAKQCVISAFDTDYLMSVDEVMASILHLAHNMDEETSAQEAPVPDASHPSISAFVAACRSSHGGRGHTPRGPRSGRGLPSKCSACGSLDHIKSSCSARDDALLRWTVAKRQMIIHKYGTLGGSAIAHAALLSDVTAADDLAALPTLEECKDEYNDTEVSVPFRSVAFSSSLTPGRDLSQFWVIDSPCSINLTAFRGDYTTFAPPSAPSRMGGVGVDVEGSGSMRISVLMASGKLIHRGAHALYTPDMSSCSAQHTSRLLSVSWMQSHSGCEFLFPTDSHIGLLGVPKVMGVLECHIQAI
jgi:hypothetical protein